MAKEIQLGHSAHGATLYALIRNSVAAVWNGAAFVTYATAGQGTYAVSLTEQGTASKYYVGDFPAAAAGVYRVPIYSQAGGSPAEGDTLITTLVIEWDGTAVVSLYSRLAPTTAGNTITVDGSGNVKLGNGPQVFLSGNGTAKWTQTAGTRIRVPLGGEFLRAKTHVTNFNYTGSGTAHTVTLMKGASRSTVVGAVDAAGTSVVSLVKLTDGGGNDIAASDVLCIQLDNQTWHLTTVSALDSAKTTITINDAVPAGRSIADGAKIVCYGVAGDSYHAHQQYTMAASAVLNTPLAGGPTSLLKADYTNEPIVFDSNNATNAGTLNNANFGYTVD